MTDDLLWLAFVAASYIRETGDFSHARRTCPVPRRSLASPLTITSRRAFERVFSPQQSTRPAAHRRRRLERRPLRRRPRGEGRIGLARPVPGRAARRLDRDSSPQRTARSPPTTASAGRGWSTAINEHAMGRRVVLAGDARRRHADRRPREPRREDLSQRPDLGDARRRRPPRARRFVHAPPCASIWSATSGALLLAPAYDVPDERIGYITRYAPGLRENGGVYTHAATWAIAAACKDERRRARRSAARRDRPDEQGPRDATGPSPTSSPATSTAPNPRSTAAPAGPGTPAPPPGCTASSSEWVLGVRPEWDGLRIDPCLPPQWKRARVCGRGGERCSRSKSSRGWRGGGLRIED